eukprot:TRINITY_DN849_c1_g2_i1.p1 TRINITY_DN849_c1_g2~~TRINITY_DN849_c1_g2_i1.p1  ORF type:complete len:326 (+),score=28.56 TRINITY_DN849_c1_g2_i1:73-978(+)
MGFLTSSSCAVVTRLFDRGASYDRGGIKCFTVEVFSVEDACSKDVGGVFASMTLAELVTSIRDEFAVSITDEVTLLLNDRALEGADLPRTLSDLGISAGASLAFTSHAKTALNEQCTAARQQPNFATQRDESIRQAQRTWKQEAVAKEACFSVEVSSVSGEAFEVVNLLPSTSWAIFIETVETMMGLDGDESVTLVHEAVDLSAVAAHQTLQEAGIIDGARLTSLVHFGVKRACPLCKCAQRTLHDVLIGATHEGWGRKWNTCNYSCLKCRVPIRSGESVNACKSCKGFWHRSCRIAVSRQ